MRFWKSYFGFNRQQRRGLIVLCGISLFLLIVRIGYPYFLGESKIVAADLPLIERVSDSLSDNVPDGFSAENNQPLFRFDPNTATYSDLVALGFESKTASTLIKFRKKFVFRKNEDLKKVYGMRDDLYQKLEPYIFIKVQEKEEFISSIRMPETPQAQVQKKDPLIELNAADSLSLLKLNGIGPSFASRIIKYRKLLGGYTDIHQLKEVYGLTEETFDKIRSQLTVDPALIKKIDLNKDDFKTVNKHPYISYEQTKAIFNLRVKSSVTRENLGTIITDSELLTKLNPYLLFE